MVDQHLAYTVAGSKSHQACMPQVCKYALAYSAWRSCADWYCSICVSVTILVTMSAGTRGQLQVAEQAPLNTHWCALRYAPPTRQAVCTTTYMSMFGKVANASTGH